MTDPQLYRIANEIFTYSALLLKFIGQSTEERLQGHGVQMSGLQLNVLRMLLPETLTVSIISQRMGQDPAAIVRTVDTLERKGLVARMVDPNDRRRNPIHITDKGRELVQAVPAISEQDLPFQAIEALGIEQAAQLRDLLRQVIEQFPEGKIVAGLFSGWSSQAPPGGSDPGAAEIE